MTSLRIAAVLAALGAALITFWPNAWTAASTEQPVGGTPAPDFTGADRWFNSAPLTLEKLHGKVVLVDFWTRECINCIHTLPHIKTLYDKYASQGLVIVGVHTPEYDEEHDPALLQKAIDQYQITWPVALDNSYRIWNAYGNRYWPAIYLIDRRGHVVYYHVGEGNYDDTEQRIRQLLGTSQNA
ncbi:redoxin domain-containing protein [Dyella nitratireducens]|uniref:Thioredoxin n=1 Tax=Dyella nitratireducens TaxID=1849580 RepID=A0ABQ1G9R4_9GAMM|nr:redoxin domain-containing protein [Dyella nitratireducens]GGA39510.1 thioredoxin [Dyella nitratireducens]GLQ40449.1 thioredoxin [Dyella nitratireducens]